MTTKRSASFDLDAALDDPGFTPRRSDVPALVDRICSEGAVGRAAKALVKLGAEGLHVAIGQPSRTLPEDRAVLTEFVARSLGVIAARSTSDPAVRYLVERLSEPDARTRRYAATGLGKCRVEDGNDLVRALAATLERESHPGVQRILSLALGKHGGEVAVRALAKAPPPHGALEQRDHARARLMAERSDARQTASRFDGSVPPEEPTRVVLHCRGGLEEVLRTEIDPSTTLATRSDRFCPGRVDATLIGAPDSLLRIRTMTKFGFELPIEAIGLSKIEDVIVRSITSNYALKLFNRFTDGSIRYRLSWAQGGKKRSLIYRIASEVAARCPQLVNDPAASAWQVLVEARTSGVVVELLPSVDDPRFSYRVGDVPAASHPTIAAALARLAGVRADDIVWDPFVGSGTELCERARLGPYARLVGSDTDPIALDVARRNIVAAGLERCELVLADALRFAPDGVTAIVTNPPMGRRVLRGEDLGALLSRFIRHAADVLVPGGRLVWISPLPAETLRNASEAGLATIMRREIDMGGFSAELQAFERPRRTQR